MALTTKASFQLLANSERNIQDFSEMVRTEILTHDENDIFTLVPNIKGKQQIATSTPLEYITKADPGCGQGFSTPTNNFLSQQWNPYTQTVKLKYCKSDFEQSFTQWLLKEGLSANDISETQMARFLRDQVVQGIKADRMRIILHGYSDIGNDSILGSGVVAANYNNIEMGLIKTLLYFGTISAVSGNKVSIPKNAEALNEDAYALADGYAHTVYRAITDTVDFEGDQIITSNTLYRNYEDMFLKAGNFPLDSTKTLMQNGIPAMSAGGARLVNMKMYDKYRAKDFTVDVMDAVPSKIGEKTDTPHFAVYSKKSNLLLGVDSEEALSDIELEYVGGSDEAFYIKAQYKMDFKVANPYEIKWAI